MVIIRSQGPAAALASADTSDREIYPTPEDSCNEYLQRPIVATKQPILSRKEKREIKKLEDKQERQKLEAVAAIRLQETLKASDVEAAREHKNEDDELDSDEEDEELSKNQRKKIARKTRLQELKQTQASQAILDSSTGPPTTHLSASKPTIPKPPTMPPTNMPLLVCSIGNPGATYANTLHSAGHTILNIIRERGLYNPFLRGLSGSVATPNTTRYSFTLTGFRKDDGALGLGPDEDNFTLWQSTKQMNISGPGVQQAWRKWSAEQRAKGFAQCRLVVVHDELESELGKVGIKMGTASPRGHNGLKSVQASMGSTPWWRVGVGIGRPESREPDVVAKYVLRKMNSREQLAMDKASVGVLKALRKIAEGKA